MVVYKNWPILYISIALNFQQYFFIHIFIKLKSIVRNKKLSATCLFNNSMEWKKDITEWNVILFSDYVNLLRNLLRKNTHKSVLSFRMALGENYSEIFLLFDTKNDLSSLMSPEAFHCSRSIWKVTKNLVYNFVQVSQWTPRASGCILIEF